MRISIVALAASVISTAAASASDLRYTYTGDDFTNVDVHGPSTPFTTSDFISFTFTSPYAVGPNLSDAGFAGPITSWSLTLGPLSYSSLDPTSVLYSINFSTNSSGQITAWQFTTQTNVVAPNLQPAQYLPTPYEEEVASFNLPPTLGSPISSTSRRSTRTATTPITATCLERGRSRPFPSRRFGR